MRSVSPTNKILNTLKSCVRKKMVRRYKVTKTKNTFPAQHHFLYTLLVNKEAIFAQGSLCFDARELLDVDLKLGFPVRSTIGNGHRLCLATCEVCSSKVRAGTCWRRFAFSNHCLKRDKYLVIRPCKCNTCAF